MTARPEAEHDPVNDLLPVYENTPTTQCECEKKKKKNQLKLEPNMRLSFSL